MLEELRIQGLGVIEESVLDLGPGFTAITGETGAGKTMVVTALGLLLGSRADAGAVRSGARHTRVEGVLSVDGLTGVIATVEGAGGVVEDHSLVLARQVSAQGRSRAFAGGAGIPVTTLAGLSDQLVAVHGQSDQHRLLAGDARREALDTFAGPEAAELRAAYEDAYAALRDVERELDEVVTGAQERAREADLLRFGVEEIIRVAPQPGEDAELEAEEGRLAHADALRIAAQQARSALSSDEGAPDALAAVAVARGLLEGVREHDSAAAALADRTTELSYVLSDLAADVASYASRLDSDPVRLAAVSERRSELTALTRKYGESVDEVLTWAATAAERLSQLEDSDGAADRLRTRRAELRATLGDTGGRLSAARSDAAHRLADGVGKELTALAMPHARLVVTLAQHEHPDGVEVGQRRLKPGPTGLDEVDFLLAANAGAEPRSLAKVASGGELARVMLALEVVLSGSGAVPTLVFDEVDAGVGGAAAVEVGRRLAQLSRAAQVLVVTHLPQVAAFADRHVLVTKSEDGRVTTSDLTVLDDADRVKELARMLAGVADSGSAQAHARELLSAARARQPGHQPDREARRVSASSAGATVPR